jgi:nucleoid-associated protein YgaU
MLVGSVTSLIGGEKPFLRPPGKDDFNDLPRQPRSLEPNIDRAARVGDPRNDENLIINQLHVAFLRCHNRLIDEGHTFRQARRILRQHYQHVVVHDYLDRVADPTIVQDILANGPRAFDPAPDDPFMPLEFAVAGFRFGHSMVRGAYDFNLNFNLSNELGTMPATLELLFNFTALSGQLGENDTLPDNWIIEWENLLDAGGPFDHARRIDTKLVEPLFALPDVTGIPEPGDAGRLAVRNLLRGYLLRIPTGQAVAGALGLTPLTSAQITAAAADPDQASALVAAGFDTRTPLWFYVLAEAAHGGGNHLGPVGSIIVADVLIGLVKRSQDSIFDVPGGFQPSLPAGPDGQFTLLDLLTFAGVVPGNVPPDPAPRIYTVVAGDTLRSIAAAELGNAARWPQIFALNRPAISDPNRIFPGQQLTLPDPADASAIPRVYQVRAGDTLIRIANRELGDSRRWTEILDLNRVVIADPNRIFIGQFLILPAA